MGQNDGSYKSYTAAFADTDQYSSGGIEVIGLESLERNVRFSLKHCDTTKKHCIRNVAKDPLLLESLYKRLGHFEDMTWKNAMDTTHEGSISIEKRSSTNYKDLKASYSDFSTYGHMRIAAPKKPIFRVFGAVSGGLFYILRFDVDGATNH